MTSWIRGCIALVLLGAIGRAAAGQESINHASVSGRITDPQGAVVSGAKVTARHLETNLIAEAVSDKNGRFRFPFLQIGREEIAVRSPGFAPVARVLNLTAGGAFELPIALAVGAVDTAVTVTAGEATLEAARSQIAGTVSQPDVARLPLNGRSFLDLALLVPGVSPTNVGGGTQLFSETSAVPGVGLSIGSQRNLSNSFIVDGLSANDDAAGLSGMAYGVDAIDQVQVVTSGGQAELGRALGGYISVVTRSGTNALRGAAYDYERSDRLNAVHPLLRRTLPMTQHQFGGTLGGPIRRDRTFFFGNVERRHLDQSGLATVDVETVPAINGRLAAVGYRGPAVATGVFATPVRTTTGIGKVDHRLADNDQTSVRYAVYGVRASNARGAGALSAPSASAGLDSTDYTVAWSNILATSPKTVLETRAQLARSALRALPSDPIGPAVSIAGVAAFGTLSSSPTGRANTMVQLVNTLSRQAGPHAFRVGVDVLTNRLSITFPRAVRGSYAFSSLENFFAGTYNNAGFTQMFGASAVTQRNPNLGLYAQDEWKIGPALTVNAGLRYDLQWLDTIHTDGNNLSPRLGAVWAPTRSRRTLLRGSAGLFYDRVPLRAVANALLSAGNTTDVSALRQIALRLSPSQSGAPVFPAILTAAVPSTTLVSFTTMDRRLQNARSLQVSVEVEHQLGPHTTVSVGYDHLRGSGLLMSINQNVPRCAAAGSNNGCRPVAAFADNNQYSSAGASDYNAVHVSLIQRLTQWGSYRMSYTVSKSMNNVGEAFFNSPIDPFDLAKDWGRSDDDQRHRFVLNGSVRVPSGPGGAGWRRLAHDITFSAMLQYYSALPFNITSGVTTVQGTAGRPIVNGQFIARNAGTGGDFLSMSARLSRAFRLTSRASVEGLIEGFNLSNRRNSLARNTNFGAGAFPDQPAPNFGQVTSVADPRSFQLGVRFLF